MLTAIERDEIGGETNDLAWADVLGFFITNAALATGAVILATFCLGVVSTYLIGAVTLVGWVVR